uniref:RING-type E3 ubiquitin transferase n=1 Tax=Apteryx owenii TaxID=8824 RepID=A0A8B9SDF8_APTOW
VMDEAQERQKFISSAQYVREMPYKMDSEHQVCQKAIRKTKGWSRCVLKVIFTWTSANECSGSEQKSAIKSSGNKRGFKFPILDKISVKQKLKPNISFKKIEKSVLDPNKVTAGEYWIHEIVFHPDIRNSKLNGCLVVSLSLYYCSEHAFVLFSSYRQILLITQQFQRRIYAFPQDCAGPSSETVFENRERSQGRKSLIQSSKLNLDHRALERKSKIGSVPAQAQAQPSTSTSQETSVSSTTNRQSGLSLLHHKRASFRSRGKNFFSIQHLNMKDSHEEMEETKDANQLEKESLSLNASHFPSTLGQSHRSGEISLAQGERHSLEEGTDDKTTSSRWGKSSHWLLRKKKLTVSAAEPQRRKSRDSDKLYTPDGNYIKDANHSELENRPTNSSLPKRYSNASSTDKASAHNYCKEWHFDEHNQKRYGGSVASSTSTVPVPLHCALNSQGSLTQSAQRPESSTNRSSATVSSQTLNLDGSSKFSMRTPLCLLQNRDSLSTPGSFDFSPPLCSIPEDSSLLEDSINSSFNTSSPSSASHNRASLHNSLSSLSLDSAILQSVSSEEVKKPQTDQERLRQLQESLLAEDSGEEGDRCRICQIAGGSPTNPLLEPCGCVGSLQFVHEKCLKKWLEAKIKSGADLEAVRTCELCKQSLTLDLDDFNLNEYYRNHHYSQAQNELTDLYLVLLSNVWELMNQSYNPATRNRVRKVTKTTGLPVTL